MNEAPVKEPEIRSCDSKRRIGKYAGEADEPLRNEQQDLQLLPPRPASNPLNSDLFLPIEMIVNSERDRLAYHLVLSEQQYVRNLYILIHLFKDPLAMRIIGRTINTVAESHFLTLFGNIEDLIIVNTTLLSSIIMRIKRWSPTQTIADIFTLLLPDLRQYNKYSFSFEEACKILYSMEKRDITRTFLEQQADSDLSEGLDLFAFLLMPLQRIPRYYLILSQMLEHTEESHPDHLFIKTALLSLKDLKSELIEAVKEAERQERLEKIARKFIDIRESQIKQPGRHFFYDGPLWKVCRKENKLRHFFLFSDCLIYAYPQANNRFLLARQLDLASSFMVEDVSPLAYAHAFSIRHESKSFIVFASTSEEKAEWFSAFRIAMQDHPGSLRPSSSAGEALAPVWVPDGTTKTCTLCDTKFTTFYRRHHCRQCGIVVCGPCSTKKKYLAGRGKKVKVCDKCVEDSEKSNQEGEAADLPTLFYTYAKADFTAPASDPKKLSIKKSEILKILLVHPSGWRLVEKEDKDGKAKKMGWVPSEFLGDHPSEFILTKDTNSAATGNRESNEKTSSEDNVKNSGTL